MRDSLPVPQELLPLLDEAARYDRGPALRKSVLQEARDSIYKILHPGLPPWYGLEAANTHVLVPILAQCIPKMKYNYVVRNALIWHLATIRTS